MANANGGRCRSPSWNECRRFDWHLAGGPPYVTPGSAGVRSVPPGYLTKSEGRSAYDAEECAVSGERPGANGVNLGAQPDRCPDAEH